MDIGGTSIHAALVADDGAVCELPSVAVDSSPAATPGAIVETFAAPIRAAWGRFDRVGICIPGPFDYRNGVSLMTHKFRSLHGIDLRAALIAAVPALDGMEIVFRHDANSFLLGEIRFGVLKGAQRAGAMTLGTGLGAAFYADGHVFENELGSPAPEVTIWKTPYRDGCVEDYVSGRAVVEKYRGLQPGFAPSGGAKAVEEAATAGDAAARRVYSEFGADLGTILIPWCQRLKPEAIVLGGQVAKGFALFGDELRKALGAPCPGVVVTPSRLGATAALLGAAAAIRGTASGFLLTSSA